MHNTASKIAKNQEVKWYLLQGFPNWGLYVDEKLMID